MVPINSCRYQHTNNLSKFCFARRKINCSDLFLNLQMDVHRVLYAKISSYKCTKKKLIIIMIVISYPFATTAAFPLSFYTKRLIFIARKNVLANQLYCSSIPVKYILYAFGQPLKSFTAPYYYLIYIIRADTRCPFKRFTIYLIFYVLFRRVILFLFGEK